MTPRHTASHGFRFCAGPALPCTYAARPRPGDEFPAKTKVRAFVRRSVLFELWAFGGPEMEVLLAVMGII